MKKALTLRRIIPVILLAVILGWIVSGLFGPQIKRIDTSTGLEILAGDLVEQARIIDRDQRVQLTLVEDWEKEIPEDAPEEWADFPATVEFFWTQPQGEDVVQAVTSSELEGGYDSEVPTTSIWSTMLFTLLPLLLIVGLFWFILSGAMQGGGGGRLMQFGKSKE